jgi:hypothetical protein
MKCPLCGPDGEGLRIDLHVHVGLTWTDALKLWLAGPEIRHAMLDEIRLKLAELVLSRAHPENEERR